MKDHAYIDHSQYGLQDLNSNTKLAKALYLTTIQMEHSDLLKLGLDKYHEWKQKNPHLTHVLNVRSSEQFEKIFMKKL